MIDLEKDDDAFLFASMVCPMVVGIANNDFSSQNNMKPFGQYLTRNRILALVETNESYSDTITYEGKNYYLLIGPSTWRKAGKFDSLLNYVWNGDRFINIVTDMRNCSFTFNATSLARPLVRKLTENIWNTDD